MQRCEDCRSILRASGACPKCDGLWSSEPTGERRRPDRDPAILAGSAAAAERAIETAMAGRATEVSI